MKMEEKQTKTFENFTNLYELSKTLRFELKPVGSTLKNMKTQLEYDPKMQTFLKDQNIEDAYQRLKPKVDEIHEQFITESLESGKAKEINFEEYCKAYQNRKEDEDVLRSQENALRIKIGETFLEGGSKLKAKYPDLKWKKGSSEAKGSNMLSSQDVLEVIRKENQDDPRILEDLAVFKGFFTYFSGFNQNRENYYETGKEASTAVATRIIHENLPKFCDNVVLFEKREQEYLDAYDFLQKQNINLVDKNNENLFPISRKIFDIAYFSECLSQKQIEKYNAEIGNANFIINLYNQQNGKNFKKLPKFKTLYKQIGCGERDSLFFALKYDLETELTNEEQKKKDEVFSVEKVLNLAKEAGEKYFSEKSQKELEKEKEEEIRTIYGFTSWLRNIENWEGIYWSKAAINTISNKYFANWHSITDKLKEKKDETVARYTKKEGEEVKINDAVELQGLFEALDKFGQEENWSQHFFKESILKEKSIDESKSPSENLIRMLCEDIEQNAKEFLDKSDNVIALNDYKSEESKKLIKDWMDHALAINRMIKYFRVKPSKTKGKDIEPHLTRALENLLDNREEADWFKWYDALRNYLTKKPQDDAKQNKLKLNFECPILLGGWSDGQEKTKKSVILKNNGRYYLGILKKSSLFDTSNEENAIYQKSKNVSTGRLILANLKFQTLAGKGFIRDYKQSYGDMGKENPLYAVECLQELIEKQYLKKYPLLQKVVGKKYSDKKEFDKDIQETLKECYVCEFAPINWNEVEDEIKNGNIYVFEIATKDLGKKSKGKPNLQSIYWENVFCENSPHQLNGGGEIFYRKKALKKKNRKQGYEAKPWIIDGKRFTENEALEQDKETSIYDGKSFFFHCPIKLNYKAKSYGKPEYAIGEINEGVNQYFSNQEEIYFLGLDRGEKHLVYYSLANKNGKIIKQGSFNEINGHNYLKKLAEREGERNEARKNWQRIENIKELKEGYISQLVHEIAKIVQDKPTYIVLEDLNTGFKRGRQKIERQIYQKFELALAKKLNFLVNKTANQEETGSVTKALQFTPPVQNYQDIENRKQVGIMLYTRANYTSQTDPLTGWRKTIYLKKGSEKDIRDQIGEKFDDIGFEGGHYFFEYTEKNSGKKWRLWSGHDNKPLLRYRGKRGKDKNEWIINEEKIEEMLNELFSDFDKERSFYSQIFDEEKELQKINNQTAWESLRYIIDLIQQIRNSGDTKKGQDDNFLLSPVIDEKGKHFDSRDYENLENSEYPKDADANGAFNIARKGILMNAHIEQWKKNGSKKTKKGTDLNLFVSDEEWDLYLKKYEKWKSKLPIFSSKKEFKKMMDQK